MRYSVVVDPAAIKQHSDWAARKLDGEPYGEATCTFSPYVDEVMVPMFKELVDRYGVDGECWGTQIDYCDYAKAAWKAETGLDEMPSKRGEKNFERFRQFQRQAFKTCLAHYVDAMHDSLKIRPLLAQCCELLPSSCPEPHASFVCSSSPGCFAE